MQRSDNLIGGEWAYPINWSAAPPALGNVPVPVLGQHARSPAASVPDEQIDVMVSSGAGGA